MTNETSRVDFFMYFGSAQDNVYQNGQHDVQKILTLQKKLSAQSGCCVESIYFPKQTHSADVIILETMTHSERFLRQEGDAVITREKNIAIGVVTADCLPLILYDEKNKAIGVIHAGWRGLSKKIISATILKMKKNFGTRADSLRVFLGPCAKVCCYEVQKDFYNHFLCTRQNLKNASETVAEGGMAQAILTEAFCRTCENHHNSLQNASINVTSSHLSQLPYSGSKKLSCTENHFVQSNYFETRDEKLFFNQYLYARQELLQNGVRENHIDARENSCTICQAGFCSVRKDKENAGRQPTVVFLR